jgi:hypothetical protein
MRGAVDVDRVLQDIRDAARRYPFIHKVVLFGSRARGIIRMIVTMTWRYMQILAGMKLAF